MLFLGVGAAIANVDVRYDATGLHVRTGWLKGSEPSAPSNAGSSAGETPTRAELAALEERLRAELVRPAVANGAGSGIVASPVAAASSGNSVNGANADLLRRARALVEESERRQQRELALRLSELVRDVNAQRQSDLARIDRSLGVIQNSTGVEMMRQRETLNNILVRTSLQK
jgi:hypothetical protein